MSAVYPRLKTPTGWTTPVLSPLVIGPGTAGSATFTVTSPAAAVAGNYTIGVSVADNITPTHNGSASATYTVFGCAPAAPAVTISPASQGGNPGATLTYTVQVSNRDSASCSATTFYPSLTTPTG